MPELTIKINLPGNAAYITKLEAIRPTLGLLFECDEHTDISSEYKPTSQPEHELNDIEIEGRVIFTADFQLTIKVGDKHNYDAAAVAREAISEQSSSFVIYEMVNGKACIPGTHLSNIQVAAVSECRSIALDDKDF